MQLWLAFSSLFGVIVGGLITWGHEAWRGRQARMRDRAYVASVCSARLRLFAEDCTDVSYDDGKVMGRPARRDETTGEEWCAAQVDEPESPVWPESLRWEALDPGDIQLIFRLPVVYRRMKGAIDNWHEHDEPPHSSTMGVRQSSFATLAIRVLELAARIEKSADLKSPRDGKRKAHLAVTASQGDRNFGPSADW